MGIVPFPAPSATGAAQQPRQTRSWSCDQSHAHDEQTMPERAVRFDGNCQGPATQMVSRGVGTGTRARGCCCEQTPSNWAPLALVAGANGRSMPINSARRRRRQVKIRPINTNISLKSICQLAADRSWYSISLIRIAGVPARHVDHRKQLACGLSSWQSGGIDLPARPKSRWWTKLQTNQPLATRR